MDIKPVVMENLNVVENGQLSMLVEILMILTMYTVMMKSGGLLAKWLIVLVTWLWLLG